MQDRRNLFNKVWDAHAVRELPSGQTQLFIGQHLVHEVTSPQAFEMLRERGLKVLFPERTLATVDHIIPTDNVARPFADELAEQMMSAIESNCREFGIRLLTLGDDRQGIVHIIGPELGVTQPGITLVCGDSHTSTHGAFRQHFSRYRHQSGRPRTGHSEPRTDPSKGPSHRDCGRAASRRLCEGRDPHHYQAARGQRRGGLRL